MAIVDDDMKDDYIYSTLLDTLNSNVGEEALSLEDLAWADSCLNKHLDASESDLSSIKDALLEILSSQSGQVDFGATEVKSQLMIDNDLHSSENVISLELGRGSDEDEDLIDDDIESTENSDEEDQLVLVSRRARARRSSRIKSVFRPNYTEDVVKEQAPDCGMDLALTTLEVESSSNDIFKVWDLGISDEQDDFTKQLNKAFVDFPQPVELTQDDSTPWKDVMHVSLDDLIAGIGDLSLKQNTK